jgi:hypothetical protein
MATDLAAILDARTLEPVVRWMLARDLDLRIVWMDEFTSDVVLAVEPSVVVVFDAT